MQVFAVIHSDIEDGESELVGVYGSKEKAQAAMAEDVERIVDGEDDERTIGEWGANAFDGLHAWVIEPAQVEGPDVDTLRSVWQTDLKTAQDRVFTLELENQRFRGLLQRAIPMLVKLGDFWGNGPVDSGREGSLGRRCDLIGDIHKEID